LGFGHYQDRIANTPLDQQVSLQDYAVSNRGLRANLVGTAEPMADRIRSSERAGVDLLLVLCRPQRANMERCAETVIPLVRGRVANAA
jgi:FMNH2-dependent dimethyl sulfone monooxygenase